MGRSESVYPSEKIREWYDGYRIGNANIYCPWDVINYIDLLRADAEAIEKQFTAYLKKTISIRDTAVRKEKKENFYHGILLGLLSYREDWDVSSNAESGTGYSDILVETEDEAGIVIEIKYAENGDFERACKEALRQIEEKGYEERLVEYGAEKIIKYGIACWKKKCKVVMYQDEE